MRILIVEDDKIAQKVANFVITSQLNLECDIAGTAQEAKDYTDKVPYDLILMDIGLDQGNNGFDLTANIRNTSKINTKTPVIAVTAHIEEDFGERADKVGMWAVLAKPLTAEKLQKFLDRL